MSAANDVPTDDIARVLKRLLDVATETQHQLDDANAENERLRADNGRFIKEINELKYQLKESQSVKPIEEHVPLFAVGFVPASAVLSAAEKKVRGYLTARIVKLANTDVNLRGVNNHLPRICPPCSPRCRIDLVTLLRLARLQMRL